jgi:folate-binding Fe-S cluster repair protein YgfZ
VQGLTTRDVLNIGQSGIPLYTAMLNSKGRQMFDLFLYRDASDHNAVLMDCPADSSTKLLSLLQRFKLRSAVSIDDASKEFRMVAAFMPAVAEEPEVAGVYAPSHLTSTAGRAALAMNVCNMEDKAFSWRLI